MEGCLSPLPRLSKDQRVYHTAIVENKRPGHTLALVEAEQNLKYALRVMTNSEKNLYRKTPRKVYGVKQRLALQPEVGIGVNYAKRKFMYS